MSNKGLSILEKKVRDHYAPLGCKHCFTFYKNDEVACHVTEIIGHPYLELECQNCEAFESDNLDFWLSEMDPEEFTDKELAAYQRRLKQQKKGTGVPQ